LLSQTAQKIQNGLGYDPARSFGNPLYEFFLALFPQPAGMGRLTNGINLLLSVWFLLRLPRLFPDFSEREILYLRVLCLAFPVFTSAASSSIEFMPTWVFMLEAFLAVQLNRKILFTLFFAALIACRIEFSVFFLLLFPFVKHPFRRFFGITVVSGVVVALIWVGWMSGKNPLPWTDFSGYLRFYLGRLAFLGREAGLMVSIYGLALAYLFHSKAPMSIQRLFGLGNLAFFAVFPFEWAYLFPAFLVGMSIWIRTMQALTWFVLPWAALSSCLTISQSNSLEWDYPRQMTVRKKQIELVHWASNYQSRKPLMLLFGATVIPVDILKWESDPSHRIFYKKGTGLVVAERLLNSEILYFHKHGFQIIGKTTESGGLKGQGLPIIWQNEKQWQETMKNLH
jgi:hypothetical protein